MLEEVMEAAEMLWREFAKDRAHLGAECTAGEGEDAATWCLEPNEQHPQRHSKDDQNLTKFKEMMECRHQRKKKCGRMRKTKTEFGGGHQGESNPPEVYSAIQEDNVE
jgi:hypothetical protein